MLYFFTNFSLITVLCCSEMWPKSDQLYGVPLPQADDPGIPVPPAGPPGRHPPGGHRGGPPARHGAGRLSTLPGPGVRCVWWWRSYDCRLRAGGGTGPQGLHRGALPLLPVASHSGSQ